MDRRTGESAPPPSRIDIAARAICETLFGPYDPKAAKNEFSTSGQSLIAAKAALAALGLVTGPAQSQ